jgi:hypothetical protein
MLSMAVFENSGDREIRTYAEYGVFKGKGAMKVKIVAPTFQMIGPYSRTISREGGLLLEFAKTIGTREYDWNNKGTFLLDVTECGGLLTIDRAGAEFVHDPNMGSPLQSQITKKVKILPMEDGKGLFFSLAVTDKQNPNANLAISIPVSWAEFEVIRKIIEYGMPRFLGFDQIWPMTTVSAVAAHDTQTGSPMSSHRDGSAGDYVRSSIPQEKSNVSSKPWQK